MRSARGAEDWWGLTLAQLHFANALFRLEDFDRLDAVLTTVESNLARSALRSSRASRG